MVERRRYPRRSSTLGKRSITIHGSQGPVLGQSADESEFGLGVHVADPRGMAVGQMVLLHRLDRSEVVLGLIRRMEPAGERGYCLGIQLAGPAMTRGAERLPSASTEPVDNLSS